MKALRNGSLNQAAKWRCRLPIALVLAGLLAGALAQATAGLPWATSVRGRWSERTLLDAAPELQEAYVAGALDAFMAVHAEGEAFAAEGLDPRDAYAVLHEALALVPPDLPAGALREALIQSLGAQASDRSAALAVWRALAFNRCCWSH